MPSRGEEGRGSLGSEPGIEAGVSGGRGCVMLGRTRGIGKEVLRALCEAGRRLLCIGRERSGFRVWRRAKSLSSTRPHDYQKTTLDLICVCDVKCAHEGLELRIVGEARGGKEKAV